MDCGLESDRNVMVWYGNDWIAVEDEVRDNDGKKGEKKVTFIHRPQNTFPQSKDPFPSPKLSHLHPLQKHRRCWGREEKKDQTLAFARGSVHKTVQPHIGTLISLRFGPLF